MHVSSSSDAPQHPKYLDALAGAIAGCIARIILGPLDVIKIRFQVQLEPIRWGQQGAKPKYTGFVQALTTIAREEGVKVGDTATALSIRLPAPSC